MSTKPGRPASRADRLFRALVRAFPFDFRSDHAREMEQTFQAQRRAAYEEGSAMALARLWLETIRDLFTTAPREHVAILWQDVGYALRALRRAPVFASSAVLTLAFGMSAMTGMFTIVNAVMFRPLPVDRPEQLVSISHRSGFPYGLSFRDLQDYREESAVLTDAIGYAPQVAALDAGDGAERTTIELVTDNYFSLLGVQPAAGRLIHPNEGRARGDAPVLVLAYSYWQSRFGGDPSIIGRSVRLNSRPFTIIGVASPAFGGTEALLRVAAYVPAWMFDTFREATANSSILDDRARRTFTVLGRLKPGVSLAQARADLDVRAAALARDYPSTHKDVSLRVLPETHTRPNPDVAPFLRVATPALAGLAAVLLLITSANVANLLMARAASRGREVALRAALGARRGRIVRQPNVAVYDVRPMSVHLDNGSAFFLFRVGAFITSVFGGLGVLLASIGLYGMIAYHVGQRTQEIGVRMALGARAGDIIRDVLVRGGRYALIGIVIGIVLAGALAQMLRPLLVGVSPFDPLTYTAVALLLMTISLLASFVPARRATVVDPLVALRGD